MAPLGRPQFAAFAGILPSAGPGLSLDHGDAFYQLSASYRVAPRIGLDASVLGTGRKAILDGGVVWQSGLAQVRLSALLSSSLDYGASIRASSSGKGPLAFSFDLRTIKSRDGRPLMPVASSRGTFSEDPEAGFGDRGSYTQAIGVASYRLGDANFRLTGLYRRGGTEDSTYSIGASVDMPVIRTGRWDIVVQADVRKSEHELASFLGVRFLLNRGELALSGSAGTIHQSGRPGDDERLVGEAQLAWARTLANEGQLSTDAAIGRDSDGSYARASAYARTPLVNARADLLHQFGDLATTQYAATLESGFVMSGHGVGMSGREMNDSAVEVSADGIAPGQRFELLVDEVARGTVGADRTTRVFLQPYRSYHIRLRPLGAQAASFDTAARQVTLYPGSVAALHWDVTPLFVLFGQAVDGLGRPVANAEIKGAFGIGRSDGEGYFQIETRSGDVLGFEPASAPACAVTVGKARQRDGYVSGGKVQCR
jgi:outer membrane usher protein FimD/PapC